MTLWCTFSPFQVCNFFSLQKSSTLSGWQEWWHLWSMS